MPPDSNVEILRRFIDAFNRLDMDSIITDLDPRVELHEWPDAPGAQTYHGHDGVREALEVWFEAWEWQQVEIKDIRELGDDRILFTLDQRAKGRGSEIELEVETYNVYTFEGGKVTRMQLFTDREPALEAAGLTANLEEEKR